MNWYAVRVLGATEASISCLIICWREEGVVGPRLGPLQAMELPALLLPPGIEIIFCLPGIDMFALNNTLSLRAHNTNLLTRTIILGSLFDCLLTICTTASLSDKRRIERLARWDPQISRARRTGYNSNSAMVWFAQVEGQALLTQFEQYTAAESV